MRLLQEKMKLLSSSSPPPSPSPLPKYHYESIAELNDSSHKTLNKPYAILTSTYLITMWPWLQQVLDYIKGYIPTKLTMGGQWFWEWLCYLMILIWTGITMAFQGVVYCVVRLDGLKHIVQPKIFELAWGAGLLAITLFLLSDGKKPWLCKDKKWQKMAFTLPVVTFARGLSLLVDFLGLVVWVGRMAVAYQHDKENEFRTNECTALAAKLDRGTYWALFKTIALDILIPVLVVFLFIYTSEQHCAGVPK